jgi:hypothetical protein
MRTHELKTWPEFYDALASGRKTFELRKNDRDFRVDDYLTLREWDPETQKYSGRMMTKRISYMLKHRPEASCAANFGLGEGHVIMALI